MKKTKFFLIILAFVGLSFYVKAQINLEQTFNGEIHYQNYLDVELFSDVTTNQIKLYNTDYSWYKTVNITLPTNYYLSSVSNFSKKLFNDDNKIEFTVIFCKYEAGSNDFKIKLYNEDGTMLKDFGDHSSTITTNVITINKQYKLIIRRHGVNASTEIYSLPGIPPIPPVGVSNQTSNEYQPPFPNPANAIITLPYQLKQGEMSVMNIYNSNGQLIETKQIGSDFDKILLNVSGYTKGMYVYEVNGVSNKFVVE